MALDPGLTEIDLPANLAVSADYGETLITGAQPGAVALENYLLTPAAQAVLAANGFSPPAPVPAAVPEPASLVVLGRAWLASWRAPPGVHASHPERLPRPARKPPADRDGSRCRLLKPSM